MFLKNIFNKFKALESRCDFALCEGTDYTEVSSAFKFDCDAGVANDLSGPIIAVVNEELEIAEQTVECIKTLKPVNKFLY